MKFQIFKIVFDIKEIKFLGKGNLLTSDDDEDGMDEIPLMYGGDDEGFEMDENDSLVNPRKYRYPNQSRLNYYLTEGWSSICGRCWDRLCRRRKEYKPRTVPIGLERSSEEKFPKNVIRNQKYREKTTCINSDT
ncbi:hypothetical protein KUTeg_019235 [Tegillarca granosa]|uniref:Uncharacterized protein n=1 Tax=Tegillarca granosa TaxID=220873 RepID=A0ABQ9EBX4_TEGGR|nr:hypothetical protein KUTeg_019235 [Tegillarca granosa]